MRRTVLPGSKNLIKEVLDGHALYYEGFTEVLGHRKSLEEIIGVSGLQAEIINYILRILYLHLDVDQYRIHTNEPGTHIDKRNNVSSDIAIHDKRRLTAEKITRKYSTVPPKLIIEVDVNIDLKSSPYDQIEEYILVKTQKLFDFGTERMIWILTRPKKVMIATSGADWQIVDWNKDIILLDRIFINIAAHLSAEGIDPDAI